MGRDLAVAVARSQSLTELCLQANRVGWLGVEFLHRASKVRDASHRKLILRLGGNNDPARPSNWQVLLAQEKDDILDPSLPAAPEASAPEQRSPVCIMNSGHSGLKSLESSPKPSNEGRSRAGSAKASPAKTPKASLT